MVVEVLLLLKPVRIEWMYSDDTYPRQYLNDEYGERNVDAADVVVVINYY